MKIFLLIPVKGPINGAKLISKTIWLGFLNKLASEIILIDTAQASKADDFGKFRFKKIGLVFKILFQVLKRVKKEDKALLNFTPHGFAFVRDCLILWFLKFKKANITLHIHANGLEKKNKIFLKILFKGIKIIVINEFQQTQLGFLKNVFLVKNSLPPIQPITLKEITKNRKNTHLIYFSNLSTKKGFKRFNQVCLLLAEYVPKIELHIYGNILEANLELELKKLQHDFPFVKYGGVIEENSEKSKIFLEASALLVLSDPYYEVSPLVYIEALMHGLPIISTPQHISSSTIKENGIVFNDDFSSAIHFVRKIFNDTEYLLYCSEKSLELYEKGYNFDQYINRIHFILNV